MPKEVEHKTSSVSASVSNPDTGETDTAPSVFVSTQGKNLKRVPKVKYFYDTCIHCTVTVYQFF